MGLGMDGWNGIGWMDGEMGMEGLMDGWTEGWDEWMDEWMGIERELIRNCAHSSKVNKILIPIVKCPCPDRRLAVSVPLTTDWGMEKFIFWTF